MHQLGNMLSSCKIVHYQRLLDEMNKLPSNSPFIQLNLLVQQVIHWAHADVEIGAEQRAHNPILRMFGG